jgi:hypothetical protein
MQLIGLLAKNIRPEVLTHEFHLLLGFDGLAVLIDELLHHVLREDLGVAAAQLLAELPAGQAFLFEGFGLVEEEPVDVGVVQVWEGRFLNAFG